MEANDQGRIQEIEAQLSKLAAERSLLLKELNDLKKNNINLDAPLIGRSLNFHSYKSPEDKIELFKRLFCSRSDVFPRFWENSKTGKKGYSPVCSNEWVKPICNKPKVKCSDCSYQAFIPLDEISIKRKKYA